MALQSLVNATNILKYDYLPVWKNQINIDPSPFFEKIAKTQLVSEKIRGGAPVGLNGGFGFGTELGATPASGAQRYEGFEINPVSMYVTIEISDKALKLGGGKGSMVPLLDREIRGSYDAAKWNIARSVFGDGTGKLGTFSGALAGVTSITLNNVDNVISGLIIDVYDATAGTKAASGVRVTDVNDSTKTITVDTAVTSAHAGFITVQNSYNNEITGLSAIFDDSVTALYGVTKSTNLWIKPSVIDADNLITDTVLYRAVQKAQKRTGANIDMIMMADDSFLAYQNYMNESNVKVVQGQKFSGGAVGYKVLVGSKEIDVVNESHVPAGKSWCVDTASFKMETNELGFMNEEGGSAFVRVEGYAKYQAAMSQYGNLMCDLPGGCVEITNCAESA